MPVAIATIGAGVLGAGSSLLGSGKASSAAKDAANQAQQRYLQTRADLAPFTGIGSTAAGNALSLAQGGPTGGGPDYLAQAAGERPGTMTQSALEQTPGYQFDLAQGLKATQSAAAARGLGVSGASMKGAATFATGLANKTYQDQFNMQQQRFTDLLNLNTGQQGNLTNQFNRFNALAGIGESAAAGTGTIGASLANTSANATQQAGLAQAAGTTGVSNALTGGVNSYLGYQNFQDLMKRFGPAGTTPTAGGQTLGYQDPFAGNTMSQNA